MLIVFTLRYPSDSFTQEVAPIFGSSFWVINSMKSPSLHKHIGHNVERQSTGYTSLQSACVVFFPQKYFLSGNFSCMIFQFFISTAAQQMLFSWHVSVYGHTSHTNTSTNPFVSLWSTNGNQFCPTTRSDNSLIHLSCEFPLSAEGWIQLV